MGTAFVEAVEQLLSRIQSMPKLYAAGFQDVRRAKIRKFPFVIYYRAHTQQIEVIAVLHGSKNPRIWQDRA